MSLGEFLQFYNQFYESISYMYVSERHLFEVKYDCDQYRKLVWRLTLGYNDYCSI